jgi:hypothetical protein
MYNQIIDDTRWAIFVQSSVATLIIIVALAIFTDIAKNAFFVPPSTLEAKYEELSATLNAFSEEAFKRLAEQENRLRLIDDELEALEAELHTQTDQNHPKNRNLIMHFHNVRPRCDN